MPESNTQLPLKKKNRPVIKKGKSKAYDSKSDD